MVKLAELLRACGVVESNTVTLKVHIPAVVGVPEIAPFVEFRVSPAGIAPELIDQVYGTVPPVADRLVL
jgi:hypothetical protein